MNGSMPLAVERQNRQHSGRALWPGVLALGLIALLALGAVLALVMAGGDGFGDPGPWRRVPGIVAFTLEQAMLSTALSLAAGMALALALSRHPRFAGRPMILALLAVPLALPALVAAIGLLALFGRAGLVSEIMVALGGERLIGIYGLSGILLGHVFFNMPLVARLMLQALDQIPADQWRLASQLGFSNRDRFRLVEWPVMRGQIAGIATLVFMLCVTSFTIVLILGGGPGATTLEVAIYQALRFDFAPDRAALLTLAQITLTVTAIVLFARAGKALPMEAALSVAPSSRARFEGSDRPAILGSLVIAAGIATVLLPLAAIIWRGLTSDLMRLLLDPAVWRAAGWSVALGSTAAVLATVLALALTSSRIADTEHLPQQYAEFLFDKSASLVLVFPPVVIGAGWFLLLYTRFDVFALAPVMVITVNAAMAMPFAMRVLRPGVDSNATRHDRLCQSLGINGWQRWRLIDWPVLRRPLTVAFVFAFALSLGDLGVIALFGSDAVQTLPRLLYNRLGAYRTGDAAGLALLLALACLGLMLLAERLRHDDTPGAIER
jgi:thiamine transport system permease protein